jgi:hypothetical protein
VISSKPKLVQQSEIYSDKCSVEISQGEGHKEGKGVCWEIGGGLEYICMHVALNKKYLH